VLKSLGSKSSSDITNEFKLRYTDQYLSTVEEQGVHLQIDYPDVDRDLNRWLLGRFEPAGWKLAGALTPIAYIAWSLWLVATGFALLI
jgi:hypothetical protein